MAGMKRGAIGLTVLMLRSGLCAPSVSSSSSSSSSSAFVMHSGTLLQGLGWRRAAWMTSRASGCRGLVAKAGGKGVSLDRMLQQQVC